MEGIIIFGAIAVIVGGIIGVAVFLEKKRREAFKRVADSMKLSFEPKDNMGLVASLLSFHLFSQGRGKSASKIIHGTANNIGLHLFDYKYTTGSGKNSHTWNQTVILFISDKLNLPQFNMRPEGMFHKIGGAFGYQDIDFEENPGFSKRYLLRGPDEEAIKGAFNRNILSFFEHQKGWSVEGKGNRLVVYRGSKRIAPDKLRLFLEEGFKVFGLYAQQG